MINAQRKAEESQRLYDELLPQATEHKGMCEELLVMVESLQEQLAAAGGGQA